MNQVEEAEEIFISSTSRWVLPVGQLVMPGIVCSVTLCDTRTRISVRRDRRGLGAGALRLPCRGDLTQTDFRCN